MSENQIKNPPQSWYYGWTIVFAAALLTMITVGMRMSIGPFVIPMLRHEPQQSLSGYCFWDDGLWYRHADCRLLR